MALPGHFVIAGPYNNGSFILRVDRAEAIQTFFVGVFVISLLYLISVTVPF